ncbi:uncharacterized protein [Miscanthus floridulus]|uniref:uncharacterized protein n=1 Tax=Miscanthus floridulus TaxID=154761 RepID=UPI0034593F85
MLPDDLSGLTVLTVCSNALKVASSLLNDGPNCRWDKMSKLPNLKELQLLMLEMETQNLADIYLLLKSCHFSNLENLFVQLPATSDVPLRDLVEEVSVELPGDSLVKLGMVKVMNFNWRRFEPNRPLSLLLRKATSLNKLLLVSPNVASLQVPGVQEDNLLLKETLASGRIIVGESDDPAIQPFHPEVFIEE